MVLIYRRTPSYPKVPRPPKPAPPPDVFEPDDDLYYIPPCQPKLHAHTGLTWQRLRSRRQRQHSRVTVCAAMASPRGLRGALCKRTQ
jgi:hypothetical protein